MPQAYEFTLGDSIDLNEVRNSIFLTVLAVQGLHGRARVQLDLEYRFDEANRRCLVDAATEVGQDFARVFTELLRREFDRRAFRVTRCDKSVPERASTNGEER